MTADELKAWRVALGLSQGDAAARLGLSRPTIARYELGERQIPDTLRLPDTTSQPDTTSFQPDTIADDTSSDTSLGHHGPRTGTRDFDPVAAGVRPVGPRPKNITERDFSRLPVGPGWQVMGGGKVVSAKIPNPTYVIANERDRRWAWLVSWRAVVDDKGRAYDYETGARLTKPGSRPAPEPPIPGSRLIDKTRRRAA